MTTAATSLATPRPAARTGLNVGYVRSEITRSLRNSRYLVFALVMPIVLFLVISSAGSDDGSTLDGLRLAPYIMVSMATFGAMSGVFSTGGRIALERGTGWHRQLRLTSLTGGQYVVAKALTGFAVAVPSLVAVFLVAAVKDDVRLSAARWLLTGGAILVSLLPLCALGIFLGYVARSDNLQAVSGGIYSLLALLGGLWVPLETFPTWVQRLAEALPMAWTAKAGRAALQGSWIGWHGTAVLLAWTVVFALLAARAYGRDAQRA